MGMFSTLMNKIFHGTAEAPAPPETYKPTPNERAKTTPPIGMTEPFKQATTAAAATLEQVDVTKILDTFAKNNPEKLDWKNSIVDLMKLVGMDSSLNARKELAKDLKYTGDFNDSATMNVWLHKEVMRKLADNGGKIPQELLHH